MKGLREADMDCSWPLEVMLVYWMDESSVERSQGLGVVEWCACVLRLWSWNRMLWGFLFHGTVGVEDGVLLEIVIVCVGSGRVDVSTETPNNKNMITDDIELYKILND